MPFTRGGSRNSGQRVPRANPVARWRATTLETYGYRWLVPHPVHRLEGYRAVWRRQVCIPVVGCPTPGLELRGAADDHRQFTARNEQGGWLPGADQNGPGSGRGSQHWNVLVSSASEVDPTSVAAAADRLASR